MIQKSVDTHRVLLAALIVFVQGRFAKSYIYHHAFKFLPCCSTLSPHPYYSYCILDLSSRGGAQAWTYNYSISPNRRWFEASQWCQQHFTGMVIIQNQEETDFLDNLLPFNPKYYWIGVHREGGEWIRDQTNEEVPAEAQNWALDEPDNLDGQDCVEIYIKRETETTKWNNENCRKKKGTICYSGKMLDLFDIYRLLGDST